MKVINEFRKLGERGKYECKKKSWVKLSDLKIIIISIIFYRPFSSTINHGYGQHDVDNQPLAKLWFWDFLFSYSDASNFVKIFFIYSTEAEIYCYFRWRGPIAQWSVFHKILKSWLCEEG